MKPTGCYYCNCPALYLCDFVLRFMGNREPITCDRPLCERHRRCRGTKFFCGAAGWIDTQDYCPGHDIGTHGKPSYIPIGGGRAS